MYRLCKELGVLKPQRRLVPKYPRKLARNRQIDGPNQLWETDIKYGYIAGEDRFFFIQSVLDIYDRSVVDYHIGLFCTAKDAVASLKGALLRRQLYGRESRPVVRSDNGPQFVSGIFEEACQQLGLEHERISYRTPKMNAHIEAFHSILESDCLSRHEFANFAEAYKTVADFMRKYNTVRIHSGVRYMTPDECYQAFLRNSMKLKPIRA